MVFRPRRMGGGPSQSSKVGSNIGGGGPKTIYGTGIGRDSQNGSVVHDKYSINPQGNVTPGSSPGMVSRNTAKSVEKSRRGLGLWSALTGVGKSKSESISKSGSDAGSKNDGMKIKFINTSKKMKNDMEVKYNSRKSKQRMEVYLNEGENKKMAKSAFRRYVSNEISKQMKDLSRNSSRFKKQQGFSQMSHSEVWADSKKVYRNKDVKNILQKASRGSLGHNKDSRRSSTINFGK